MPPAKKRARAYDPAKTRAAVFAQVGHVQDAVERLTPEQFALPTRLGEWTVRELIAHIGMALTGIGRSLDLPEPPKQNAVLAEWPFATSASSSAIDEFTRTLVRDHPDLGAYLADSAHALAGQLDSHPGTRLLDTNAGALPLADYLVTRAVELVVHTDDLNAAVPGLEVPYDRQALAATTRLLADALAVKAPGGSTEVRIPPYAVVQCVEGPRHTRGTPPNVVETDPLTWLRLATGRLGWKEALGEAKVSASGERADLGPLLPLMS
ncbi:MULTISPECIES: maleylpyruvate isomerase family mycothiol-dependent enzyme [Streptomyces]|uniref:Sterol carrier family protein n=1 Tax=Streptomyces fuscus TaxID=3048495 RepID=A0ABT7J8U4_9ACTN|nr:MULTISPECIES: maleylpyruvate isomerase family mycothiol-dependent enzyme [Streptomyces]MCM1976844.1 maleylpyruvate isomerase family mycothiol-dependent enzyme [Streptomyces sp. G1]MDL2081303.1 sterol carrier family protein [Streptomyces fuscus]SBT94900.1 TIGR03083 family protein [Streptomyces sp. DI166]